LESAQPAGRHQLTFGHCRLRRCSGKESGADVVSAIAGEHPRGRRLYVGTVNLDAGRSVIRNSFLEPDYQGINRSVLPIESRSIDSLIRTQGIGDLYQIYALCKRDGNDFNLAYIPAEFTEKPKEWFDPVYMGKLYELGYRMASKGYPWIKAPPGFIMGE